MRSYNISATLHRPIDGRHDNITEFWAYDGELVSGNADQDYFDTEAEARAVYDDISATGFSGVGTLTVYLQAVDAYGHSRVIDRKELNIGE